MKIIPDRFKHHGLFIQMFLITFTTIIFVSITITWTTIRMSEQFFIEKFSLTNAKITDQITSNLESLNDAIASASSDISQSSTIKAYLSESRTDRQEMVSLFNVGQQLDFIKEKVSDYETEILITGINNKSYTTNFTYWPVQEDGVSRVPLTNDISQESDTLAYHYDYKNNANDSLRHFVIAARPLIDRTSEQTYGNMYFAIQEAELRTYYADYTNAGNDFFLLDRSGTIVSSSRSDLVGETSSALLGYAEKIDREQGYYTVGTFEGKDQIILMQQLPFFDMYVLNIIDKEIAIGDLIDNERIILITALIVMMALLIVFLVTRRLTNSFSKLVKQIANVPRQGFHKRLPLEGIYEAREIGNSFNAMLDELEAYVEKVVLAEKQQRNAELEALQQQINPHFLYNTLTSIKFLVKMGEKEEAVLTMDAFISLLQNTIGNIEETIPIKQEIENLKHYVLINQKRYGSRIKVKFYIAPDCLEDHLPKLVLQPFIENSFFHAFNQKTDGCITVLAWKENGVLICEINDNGDGMKQNANGKLPHTNRNRQLFSGIGIKNVNERLKLIYGEASGVTIESHEGKGTKVKICIPIQSAIKVKSI